MTDKTAIEKALRALYGWIKAEVEHFGATCPDDFIIEMVENALAALEAEKPGESAEECLSKMFRDIRKIGYITDPLRLTNESHDACVDLLNHFAEAYHAKQCQICQRQELPDFARFENLSGGTTDVDK